MKKTVILIPFFFCYFLSFSKSTNGETEKIATFCKVWGFLKYHHPIVAKGKLDWDKEFNDKIIHLKSLSSKKEINSFYYEWIKGLGNVKKRKRKIKENPNDLMFNYDIKWMDDSNTFTETMINELHFILDNRLIGTHYYVKKDFLMRLTGFRKEKAYPDSTLPSQGFRLLTLARYWNIINYFFPYKYRIGVDWNDALIEMIPKFEESKYILYYNLVISELIAKINDSHAWFWSRYTQNYFGFRYPPFYYKIINNKAIVVGIYNDTLCKKNDIQIGDVFFSVNHKSIAEIITENRKYMGASNEPTKIREFSRIVLSGISDSILTTTERNGIIKEKNLYIYYPEMSWSFDYIKDTSKVLTGNIGYVNLGLLQPNQVNKRMKKLINTKAIIFDVRNYPNGTLYKIAKYLNTERKPFVKFTTPYLNRPGVFRYTSPYYCGRKNKSAYKGKVILLFNETTQSHAEFTLMALQTAPRVTLIGSTTAGADGDVSLITLPGNYESYMTGLGVYYPDGRETQRVGIIPDIEVKPTIEGIKKGRDEVMEKALEVANQDK